MTTVATTFDGAVMTVDASGGVPSTAVYQGGIALRQDGAMYTVPVGGNAFDPRTLLVGDSHLQLGFSTTVTVSSFVVSGGIATITTSGNHYLLKGNKVTLIDSGTTGTFLTCSMSYGQYTVLDVTSATVFTVSATLNGVTMADGSYTSGKTWNVITPNYGKDSSIVHWLNAFSGYPMNFVGNFTLNLTPSVKHLASIDRLKANMPKSSYANVIISLGSNDSMGNGGMMNATLTTAIANAETEYANIMAIADGLYSSGIVFIMLPCPVDSGFANTDKFARAVAYLRRKFLLTRRNYRIQVIDIFGAAINGTSANGYPATSYGFPALSNNHLAVYGAYRIAKQMAPWFKALTANYSTRMVPKPATYLDDNTNLPPAWATFGTFAVGDIRIVGHSVYRCTTAGAGATSGTGPSGTGTNIVDNVARWEYLGVVSVNLSQNGLMNGSGGFNNTSPDKFLPAPVVPTGWNISNTGLTNMTNASSTSAVSATLSVVDSGYDGLAGNGWRLTLVFSGAGQITLNQNCTEKLRPGNWYQFRFTVSGHTADNTVLKTVVGYITPNAGNMGHNGPFQPTAMLAGNNTTTIPLLTTDSYEVASQPFYVDSSLTVGTDNQFNIDITSSAAGTVYVELSNFQYTPVRDPNLIPTVA